MEFSVKNLHLVPLSLISPEDVQLGRLIQDIWNPEENGINPTFCSEKLQGAIRRRPTNGFFTHAQTQERSIGGVLAKFISAVVSFKKRKSGAIHWDKMETSRLSDAQSFFDDAISQSHVQEWLTESHHKGYRKVFMITGLSIVENLRVSAVSESSVAGSGTLDVGNMVTCTTGLGDGSAECDGNALSDSRKEGEVQVPGKTVWAIMYRKISLERRTANLKPLPASISKQWKVVLKNRGQLTEREIEVRVELGEWDNEELKEDSVEWEEFSGEGSDVYIVPIFDDSDEEEDDDN